MRKPCVYAATECLTSESFKVNYAYMNPFCVLFPEGTD